MASRRRFFHQGGLGLFSILFLTDTAFSNTLNDDFQGLVVNEEEGETFQLRDGTARVKIKISKVQGAKTISFLASSFVPGDAISIHKHLNEDELIFIHKGSGIFTLDEKEYSVQAGAAALVPKGVWHGLRNTGTENIEMRFAYTPAGFEGFFREMGTPLGQPHVIKNLEERQKIDKKWGLIRKT
jgi:quercetin dioxygenase-like cupin family protein